MTVAKELLEASPTTPPLAVGVLAAAIDACFECTQACVADADADLAEEDVDELSTCIAMCVSCVDVCDATGRALLRPSQWDPVVVRPLLEACIRECETCAAECAKHADRHRHCAICEQVCRRCEQACRDVLVALD